MARRWRMTAPLPLAGKHLPLAGQEVRLVSNLRRIPMHKKFEIFVGFKHETRHGQMYVLVEIRPHVNRHGRSTSYLVWCAKCKTCGCEFNTTSAATKASFTKIAVNCPKCRKRHQEVIVGQLECLAVIPTSSFNSSTKFIIMHRINSLGPPT